MIGTSEEERRETRTVLCREQDRTERIQDMEASVQTDPLKNQNPPLHANLEVLHYSDFGVLTAFFERVKKAVCTFGSQYSEVMVPLVKALAGDPLVLHDCSAIHLS